MKKKICSALVVLAMVASLGISAMAAEFSDMPNDWSTPGLTAAVENGLLNGSDGKIMPYDNMTRAQMATIMVRVFDAKISTDISRYTDATKDDWFYEYMSKAVAMGALSGKSATTLNPNDPITRQEVCVILNRLFILPTPTEDVLSGFGDAANVADWAKSSVSAMVSAGYINGSNGNLNPTANITRAEFATIMNRMVTQYIDQPGTYNTDTFNKEGGVVIRTGNVTLDGVTNTNEIVVADGVGSDKVTFKGVNLSGELLFRGGDKCYLDGQFGDILFVRTVDHEATFILRKPDKNYRSIAGSPYAKTTLGIISAGDEDIVGGDKSAEAEGETK